MIFKFSYIHFIAKYNPYNISRDNFLHLTGNIRYELRSVVCHLPTIHTET